MNVFSLLYQENDHYFFIKEEWHMDANQWSMLIDSSALILTIIGVLIGFLLYDKQRKDNAKDAYKFFQSSLPELRQSIIDAIEDLKEFNRLLDLDNFGNPILSASLNDKFLNKINLVHLNRFYANHRPDKLSNFENFLVDSNFFGDYRSFISADIQNYRTHYKELENIFSKWQLLRTPSFFSTQNNAVTSSDYKNFYTEWVSRFNKDKSIFEFREDNVPIAATNRKALVENHVKKLSKEILPFIEKSKKANQVNLMANRIINSYSEIESLKTKIRTVLEKDIEKFKNVLSNLEHLMETATD